MSDELSSATVTVYRRPGCPYCASLRWRLRRLGVATTEVNIWQDPDAAAAVRAVAGGNETVPTVVVAGEALVNPTAPKVLEAVRRRAPDAERPPDRRSRPGVARRPVAAWMLVAAAVAASVTVDVLGRHGLSWGLDGVAVAAYLIVVAGRRLDPPAGRVERSRSGSGARQGGEER